MHCFQLYNSLQKLNLSIHSHVLVAIYSMGKQIPNSFSGIGAVVHVLSFHETWTAFWLQ